MSDIGMNTSLEIISRLRDRIKKENIKDAEEVKNVLRDEMKNILEVCDNSLKLETKPSVILVCRSKSEFGKTTSIGKIANRLQLSGKKVMVAAADTFRAAAVEQLEIWAKRVRM